ncbi:MAG: HDIG domain-containing protein [Candidatus Aenigmarchaeota archaeon]|nr:HDIG domain-containing protein [Candidatus Aenigmarchaeota archaeon]
MNREEALKLVRENINKENLIKHMLAVEAIMKGATEYLGEKQEKWELTGLLHDIDFGKTENDPEHHALITEEILKDKVDEEIIRAIKSHNFEHTNVNPETKMENILIAADAVSGLIIAAALIIPSKKLADVKVKSIKKKFKQKDFARNCNRERMLFCERAGIPKEKFFEICLTALQNISDELGL